MCRHLYPTERKEHRRLYDLGTLSPAGLVALELMLSPLKSPPHAPVMTQHEGRAEPRLAPVTAALREDPNHSTTAKLLQFLTGG